MWLLVLVLGCKDLDGDGWSARRDCDDADSDVHPEAFDLSWDGIDSDCDGQDSNEAWQVAATPTSSSTCALDNTGMVH